MSPTTIATSGGLSAGAANEVLRRIVDTGETELPSGENVEVTSHIDPACGALLQRTIRKLRPKTALEVGDEWKSI